MKTETKKSRGAPKKDITANKRLELRITEEQQTTWRTKSESAGFRSIAAWLKHLADNS